MAQDELAATADEVDYWSALGRRFLQYFTGKVDTIRASTAGATPPIIRLRPVPSLRYFDGVTIDEVTSLILRVPPKQCDLDPVPTWLVKKCCDILAPVITSMISMSFRQGVFPDTHKHALVRPRIKKPTLDPLDVKSFRPISNLSFYLN